MIFYRILYGIALLVAAVVLFFFLWGLADGTVSSFNILLWLALLACVGGVVLGASKLKAAGQMAAAYGLLLILALPGLFFAFFILMVIIFQPRWN